ncbi:MAG TPA: hypothetical protein VIM77_00275, partial [Mucilaginibacter sp.]
TNQYGQDEDVMIYGILLVYIIYIVHHSSHNNLFSWIYFSGYKKSICPFGADACTIIIIVY